MPTNTELLEKKCTPTEIALTEGAITEYLKAVDGWTLTDGKIVKTFAFHNYYETLAYINAIAYVIHAEDHHPDLAVTYNKCTVRFNTHDVSGISVSDFFCASKVDALLV